MENKQQKAVLIKIAQKKIDQKIKDLGPYREGKSKLIRSLVRKAENNPKVSKLMQEIKKELDNIEKIRKNIKNINSKIKKEVNKILPGSNCTISEHNSATKLCTDYQYDPTQKVIAELENLKDIIALELLDIDGNPQEILNNITKRILEILNKA